MSKSSMVEKTAKTVETRAARLEASKARMAKREEAARVAFAKAEAAAKAAQERLEVARAKLAKVKEESESLVNRQAEELRTAEQRR